MTLLIDVDYIMRKLDRDSTIYYSWLLNIPSFLMQKRVVNLISEGMSDFFNHCCALEEKGFAYTY